jgi:hypothetical protein
MGLFPRNSVNVNYALFLVRFLSTFFASFMNCLTRSLAA